MKLWEVGKLSKILCWVHIQIIASLLKLTHKSPAIQKPVYIAHDISRSLLRQRPINYGTICECPRLTACPLHFVRPKHVACIGKFFNIIIMQTKQFQPSKPYPIKNITMRESNFVLQDRRWSSTREVDLMCISTKINLKYFYRMVNADILVFNLVWKSKRNGNQN